MNSGLNNPNTIDSANQTYVAFLIEGQMFAFKGIAQSNETINHTATIKFDLRKALGFPPFSWQDRHTTKILSNNVYAFECDTSAITLHESQIKTVEDKSFIPTHWQKFIKNKLYYNDKIAFLLDAEAIATSQTVLMAAE